MLGRPRRQAHSRTTHRFIHPSLVLAAAAALSTAAADGPAAPPRADSAAESPAAGTAAAPNDPLAAEIERWSSYLRTNPSTDELWIEVKQEAEPVMARAGEALRDGRRLLALQRLAAVRADLSAWHYLAGRPAAERKDDDGFEAAWTRMGKTLHADLGAPSRRALDGVRPAALRAIGEAALPQVKVFYEASLDYGRNTMPDDGVFYLGAALAQRELVAFCRTLAGPPFGGTFLGDSSGETPAGLSSRRDPSVRDLRVEIDALEDDLLALYRPPASIDRHVEFIVAGSALKEARELNAAGLRYGALLRYLDAARRVVPLRAASSGAPDTVAIAQQLDGLETRLAAGDIDHSLGRLFLEIAQADLAAPAPASGTAPAAPATDGKAASTPPPGAVAAAIAGDVLPRYFAALAPARPETPRPDARVTITMVRWPYT